MKNRATSILRKLVPLSICLVVSVAALLSFFSVVFDQFGASEAALKLYPISSPVRINVLTKALSKSRSASPQYEQVVVDGMRYAPEDARFVSLLGVVKEIGGEAEQAQQLYALTLKKLPTELNAITRSFVAAVRRQDYVKAVEFAGTIGRRWRSAWPLVEASLPQILSDPKALSALSEDLGSTDLGRTLIVNSVKKPGFQMQSYRLMLDWQARNYPGLTKHIARVSNSLFGQKNHKLAYFLFRQTLTEAQARHADYVFNSNFELPLSSNPFGWTIASQPGVSIERVRKTDDLSKTQKDDEAAASSSHKISVRFRNAPVVLRNFKQNVILTPGKYELAVDFETKALVSPRPLSIDLTCLYKHKAPASLVVSGQPSAKRRLTQVFSVSNDDCPTYQISLTNHARRKNWNSRYKGELSLFQIAITHLE